jgi:carboxylesterase
MSAEISTLNPTIAKAAPESETADRRAPGGRIGVLLLHGLCGTPAEMRFVAMGLERAGYLVHSPLLAGHGGRRGDVIKTGWQEWYRSAEDALIELRKSCDTVIVSGLCLGAIIGLQLAAKHPEKVQGVTLLSPTLWVNGWAIKWYLRLLALVPFRWVANRIHFPDAPSLGIKCPRVREFVRTALAASGSSEMGTAGTPGPMVLEHRHLVQETKKLLNQVTQPTLIIHSRQDDHADLNNATYLQRNLPKRVDLVVLEDSYHMITLDKERHIVVDRSKAFIERIAEGVRAAAASAAGSGRRQVA